MVGLKKPRSRRCRWGDELATMPQALEQQILHGEPLGYRGKGTTRLVICRTE